MRPIHFLFLVAICLLWGLTFVVGKAALAEIPPMLFTGLRYLLISAILAPLLRLHKDQMRNIAICVVALGGAHFALFYAALALANNVAAVSIAVQVGVPFSVLLSVALLGEKIGIYRLAGMLAAFGGIAIVGFNPAMFEDPMSLYLVVVAAFIGAIGTVTMRRMQGVGTFALQAWIAVGSWPLLLTLSFLFEENHAAILANAGLAGWGGVIYTSLGASLIGHAGIFYLLKHYEVSLISPLTLLAPVFGAMFGVLLWGDTITLTAGIGALITLAGVLIITLREPRAAPPAPVPLARRI